LDLSPLGRGRIYLVTVVVTLLCVAAALFVDSFNFATMTADRLARAILIDVLLPTVLAAPLIFFFMSKLRELAVAHERLAVFASTDQLTGGLNRAAFTTLAEARLAQVSEQGELRRGALLILDADNFKAINDSFGHDQGDEALRLLSRAVRGVLRQSDLLGRIGGEEFAVFLPGADGFTAEAVGERIRHAVSVIPFTPGGKPHRLTVSIGGAVFDRRLSLAELLRVADQQLYVAKQNGRNRVAVSPIVHYESVPAAAA
jgi:diguanylate cyclase (GGDEF)-like protein